VLFWQLSNMEADRWLGLDLRHLVALETIADEGVDGNSRHARGTSGRP